jgi:hypothetical protein
MFQKTVEKVLVNMCYKMIICVGFMYKLTPFTVTIFKIFWKSFMDLKTIIQTNYAVLRQIDGENILYIRSKKKVFF